MARLTDPGSGKSATSNVELLRALGLLQENPIKQFDPNTPILKGESALSLPGVATKVGTALPPLLGGVTAAVGMNPDGFLSNISTLFNPPPTTPTVSAPKVTNPFDMTTPGTVQAGLNALNAVKTPAPTASATPPPLFTQAGEGGSQSAPPPPTSTVQPTFNPTLRPSGVGQLDLADSPRSTPAPTPPTPDLPQDFAPAPSFINTTAPPTSAPPVSNTVDVSNPWYIAPEELALATSATPAPLAGRTTIDNNAPSRPPGVGQLDIPQEVAPAPTPPSPVTPAPTPTPAPPPPVASAASASAGTGTTPGAATGTSAATGTGTTTPPPLPPPPPPTVVPSPPVTPDPPPTDKPPGVGRLDDPGIVPPPPLPGNQGAAQNFIPTPPPIPPVNSNQVSLSNFTPPVPNAVADRTALPTAPTAPTLNLDNSLKNPTFLPTLPTNTTAPNLNEALGGLPQSTLPTLPTNQLGNFQDYLGQNATGQMSKEEIAAQARRMAEMQINPEMAQAEQDRLAAQQRFALARSQVGLGQEEALADLDKGFDKNLRAIQAMAIRNGLTSSNIPLEQDIQPLANEYNMRRRAMAQGIQNQIAQLELEASLGDQDAGRRIQTLKGQLGLIESGANFDLSRDERNFGEQARSNRFGEFIGNEGLQRQQAQDQFGNQSDLFGLNEALRGNRMNEGLAQAGLDRQARQDQFGNEATYADMARGLRQDSLAEILAQAGFNRDSGQQDFANQLGLTNLTEGMRQSDIGNNRADRAQSFGEYTGTQGLGLDLARLNEALAQGGIDRALSQDELNNRYLDNPLRRQFLQSQIDQNNASAKLGGVDAFKLATFNNDLFARISEADQIINSTDSKVTPQMKQDARNGKAFLEAQWKQFNPNTPLPSGGPASAAAPAYDERYGEDFGQKAQERDRNQLQAEISDYDAEIKRFEGLFDNPALAFIVQRFSGFDNPLNPFKNPRDWVLSELEKKRKERAALQSQFDAIK